jgi:hypothetical protein
MLITHQLQQSNSSGNQFNSVMPAVDKLEFGTYKEKVLFILNKIKQQFGDIVCMKQPTFDLDWCTFVIENDYL